MKTIVAATDFSKASINAILFAADMAMAVNGQLHIYHALPERVALIQNLDCDIAYTETEEVIGQLDKLQEKVRAYTNYRLPVDIQLEYGNIHHLLEHTCRQDTPFAVVMAPSEKTDAQRFWLGSETLAVSHKIHVPLLLVPQAAQFKGCKKMAIATDLNEVYDTMPLDGLTHLIDAFKPALEIVVVKKRDDCFASNDVAGAIALQTHFKHFYPVLHYVQNESIADGINSYLNENHPDVLIIIPKNYSLLHKSLSRQFILHPTAPTIVLAAH